MSTILKLLLLCLALALALAAVALWQFAPQYLPHFVRQHLPEPLEFKAPGQRGDTLYRWRDEQGQWVVSDQPPESGVDYEELRYDPETNVMPANPGQRDD